MTYTTASCAGATWLNWNSTATCAGTGTGTGAAASVIWTAWTSTGAATVASGVWSIWSDAVDQYVYYAPPPAPPQLTPEEQDRVNGVRAEAQRKCAEADRVRVEAEKAAHARAEQLLLQHLDKGQARSYRKRKKFRVLGGDGASFELAEGWSGNVREFRDKKPVARFCIHPAVRVPIPDLMLSQLLMLQTDVAAFRRIANRTDLVGA